MKKLRNKFWALLLIVSAAFLSCKKQDPTPIMLTSTSNMGATSTNNPTFTRGQWKIDLFQESGTNETMNFNGYLFTFNEDGSVVVMKNNVSFTGVWSTLKENNGMKFRISFPDSPLSELNDDWMVKNETYNDLKLEHVSGGNGETAYLTFGRYFAQHGSESPK